MGIANIATEEAAAAASSCTFQVMMGVGEVLHKLCTCAGQAYINVALI